MRNEKEEAANKLAMCVITDCKSSYEGIDAERMHRIVLETTLISLMQVLEAQEPRIKGTLPDAAHALWMAKEILMKWNPTLDLHSRA